jgi:hypothetical protein
MTSLEETLIADSTLDQAPLVVVVVLHSVDSVVVVSHEGAAKASMLRSPQKRCSIGSLTAGLGAWVVVVVSVHSVRFILPAYLCVQD